MKLPKKVRQQDRKREKPYNLPGFPPSVFGDCNDVSRFCSSDVENCLLIIKGTASALKLSNDLFEKNKNS